MSFAELPAGSAGTSTVIAESSLYAGWHLTAKMLPDCPCDVYVAELPAGSAGTSSGGTNTFLTGANVSSLTGITQCPASHYCPGGSPVAAGVPQACPTGLTVQTPPGITRIDCNRESSESLHIVCVCVVCSAGVPQACAAGLTVQTPPGITRNDCNCKCETMARAVCMFCLATQECAFWNAYAAALQALLCRCHLALPGVTAAVSSC
jgi:hypothetical protein